MKKILTSGAMLALAAVALASSPVYKTKSANGTSTLPATVIFPADPGTQIRIVRMVYTTDTNNAVLSYSSGSTQYKITYTNAASTSVTNNLDMTNGLSPNAILVLQHAGVCYAATVSKFNSVTNTGMPGGGTNVVLASGGWGCATSVGDPVYLMDTPVTESATSSGTINGEALYVATLPGRPVMVKLLPCESTNQINNSTAHYD